MIRVMFVCHGNICRSPMAEMILKEMVRRRGIAEQFVIASAATSTEEIWGGRGNPVYPPAEEELERHGIPCEKRQAVQLTRADYAAYDYLIGMDRANLRNMQRMLGGDPAGKLSLLMDFTEAGGEVSDPWYTRRFDAAFRDIWAGCEGLLAHLERSGAL